MNKIFRVLATSVLMLAFCGCSNDSDDGDDAIIDYFSFQAKEASVAEDDSIEIAVYWQKNSPKAGYVTLNVSNMGFPHKAFENIDYTISTKTLEFAADEYVKTFTVTGIPNHVWQNHRRFFVEFGETDTDSLLKGSEDSYNNQINITVEDDDDDMFYDYAFVLDYTAHPSAHVTISGVIEPGTQRGYFTAFGNMTTADMAELSLSIVLDELRSNTGEGEGYSLHIALPQITGEYSENGYIYYTAWVPVKIVEGDPVFMDGEYFFNADSGYSPIKFNMESYQDVGMALALIELGSREFVRFFEDFIALPGTMDFELK